MGSAWTDETRGWWDDEPDEYGDQDPAGAPAWVVMLFLAVLIAVPLLVLWIAG